MGKNERCSRVSSRKQTSGDSRGSGAFCEVLRYDNPDKAALNSFRFHISCTSALRQYTFCICMPLDSESQLSNSLQRLPLVRQAQQLFEFRKKQSFDIDCKRADFCFEPVAVKDEAVRFVDQFVGMLRFCFLTPQT